MIPERLCVLIGLLAVPATVDAAIFAREDFNYLNGNLAGNNGGIGWSGAWTNAQGTPTVSGSQGHLDAIANQQGARPISALQAPPAGGTRIVWLSFEGKQTTSLSGTTNSFGGLGLYKGTTEQLLIGKAWPGPYEWRAGAGGGLVGPAVPVSTLATTKIIARITMVDGIATANDTLDVWLNPVDSGSVAALGAPQITRTDADLSFDTLRIRSGSGAGGSESWQFDAVTAGDDLADVVAADSDNDGILDAWEIAHGLIVGVNDAALDPDLDGLSNLQEYLRSTDPQLADTDGDTLSDLVESGTGTFVSSSDTGTNPLLKDTDADGLQDNVETNTGAYVSATDTGTNPHLKDTDADGYADLLEVNLGSNPTLATSMPTSGDLTIIGSDDFSYPDGPIADRNGGTGFDFDNSTVTNIFVGHTLGRSDWDNQTAAPTVIGGKLRTLDSGAKREFNGPGEGNVAGSDEHVGAVNDLATSATHHVYFRADLSREAGATWSGISAYDFGTERAFAGVPTAVNPASGKREFGITTTPPVYSGIAVKDGVTYTLVVKLDYDADLISLWVNPDLTGAEPQPLITAPFTLVNWTTAARLASGGTGGAGATEWDRFVVGREWSALKIFPGVVAPSFTAWIAAHPGVGDATGFSADPDHDGLTNGVEHLLGSDPAVSGSSLRQVVATATSVKFRHSQTNALGWDTAASYEWSTDLITWHASGQTDAGGATATIVATTITNTEAPLNDEIEVTVTLTGGTATRLFVRLKATR